MSDKTEVLAWLSSLSDDDFRAVADQVATWTHVLELRHPRLEAVLGDDGGPDAPLSEVTIASLYALTWGVDRDEDYSAQADLGPEYRD